MKKGFSHSLVVIFLLVAFTSACDGSGIARSDHDRILDPVVMPSEVTQLVSGNTAFALDLYQVFRSAPGNQVFSPYSISLALAMAYAGAEGDTASQMSSTLHYTLPDDQLHLAFNALDLDLSRRPDQVPNMDEDERFELTIANALWGQQDWSFLPGFLDVLASNYGAGMRLVDFQNAPDTARRQINNWVADQTGKRIKDIIPPGAIDPFTRLVLANAIYFKAIWQSEFDADLTSDRPFTLLNGEVINAPRMFQGQEHWLLYASGDGWQAVSLPYKGGLVEMVIFVPDVGSFESFEAGLTSERFSNLAASMQLQSVLLSMPSFQFEASYGLVDTLKSMGMVDPFDPDLADFSGMDGTRSLSISNAIHKAFIKADERGTEAAATTVVIVEMVSSRPEGIILDIDRPFLFAIRDVPTGTILFLGRVVDPR